MTQTPLTILLIEDNPADARLVQIALADVDANTTRLIHVDRLSEAYQRLHTDSVDIILVDLSLPDGHGSQVVRTVQAQAPQTPIVVLTGRSDEGTVSQVLASGAQGFIIKGDLNGREMLRTLREAIARQQNNK